MSYKPSKLEMQSKIEQLFILGIDDAITFTIGLPPNMKAYNSAYMQDQLKLGFLFGVPWKLYVHF